MSIVRINVEPKELASQRRRAFVDSLQAKKDLYELNPELLQFIGDYGSTSMELDKAKRRVVQERHLILFGKFRIPLPSKILESRIPDVNFLT